MAAQAISGFRGRVLASGDPGYDDARRVWNGAIDRKPALIAQCVDRADAMAAVRYAREHDLLVSVRGGAHGVAGHAVNDGGVVIDLGPMKGNVGDQNYDVPTNVDLAKYQAVTIWCARFNVNFATAPLNASH